ncbi:hypothetical protein Esi_0236_0047 [Ectocarpus siliculosus]|uniref:Uncharacterized protein n=1 Tax=Ectocarpus siliculosus TaxID=2880 RepID=D7FSM7_ECTSI|nr:hypothetical protein Esi_0236_0047 [Ectocarpus siliculosus]|eukprot:CBJ31168.1 hypothetical protein Esi_0236_0047 [Ectocarpus siliculosus]
MMRQRKCVDVATCGDDSWRYTSCRLSCSTVCMGMHVFNGTIGSRIERCFIFVELQS